MSLIKNVTNARILIHGECGTGKSEFAATIAHHCGRSAYFLKNGSNDHIAIAASNPETDLLVVDEADGLLNEFIFSDKTKKSKVNLAFDESDRSAIYIANNISWVDRSVLRRFHIILEFKPLTGDERAKIWQKNIASLRSFMSKSAVKQAALEYNLPVGIAARSADAAIMLAENKNARAKHFETMLESHTKFYNKEKPRKSNNMFRPDFINSSVPIDKLLDSATRYMSLKLLGKQRFSMLFHGLPGTGKTELAKYLADKMKLNAKVVHISDILDCYVGGSEKNIREAFENAKNKALIFDEADSMLYSREGAGKSWERSQVNEFLACMDEYKGVLICTTNFINLLDPAALRRFDIKAEFHPLTQEQIHEAVRHYFPSIDFSDHMDRLLSLKKLTAADIAIIAGRFWDGGADDVISMLENETSHKAKDISIGF